MESGYAEAIVVLHGGAADKERILSWFAARALQVRSMQAGLLIHGDITSFESAFGVDLQDARRREHPNITLPVPEPFRDHITSITIRQLPRIHHR